VSCLLSLFCSVPFGFRLVQYERRSIITISFLVTTPHNRPDCPDLINRIDHSCGTSLFSSSLLPFSFFCFFFFCLFVVYFPFPFLFVFFFFFSSSLVSQKISRSRHDDDDHHHLHRSRHDVLYNSFLLYLRLVKERK
jgi:hypothetical protein